MQGDIMYSRSFAYDGCQSRQIGRMWSTLAPILTPIEGRVVQVLEEAHLIEDDVADPDPAAPTSAAAGSPEKIAVLAARHAANVPLWHPDDSRVLFDVSALMSPTADTSIVSASGWEEAGFEVDDSDLEFADEPVLRKSPGWVDVRESRA